MKKKKYQMKIETVNTQESQDFPIDSKEVDNSIFIKYEKKKEKEAEIEKIKQQKIMTLKMKRRTNYTINQLNKNTDYTLDLY